MGKVDNNPRRGSKQFWPRKRAKNIVARVRNYGASNESKPLAFLGYKAGMTHVQVRDNNPTSMTKSQIITIPVTIVDCPKIKPVSIRFYKKNIICKKIIAEIFAKKVHKSIKTGKSADLPKEGEFTDVRFTVHTQPQETPTGNKTPHVFEMSIGGKDLAEKVTKAQELLAKDTLSFSEIFDDGQLIDVHSVTKGKGFQGPVKRYGVKVRQHKSEKTKRGPGALGAWTPKRVMAGQLAHAGKMGYHQRTEYNRLVLKSVKAEDVNQKGGIKHYGKIKGEAVLIKGSIGGAAKRPVLMTVPMRKTKKPESFEIVKISTENKQ